MPGIFAKYQKNIVVIFVIFFIILLGSSSGNYKKLLGSVVDSTETSPTTACGANNVFASSTTMCRSAIGVCQEAAYCTGKNSVCPTNPFKEVGTICKKSTNECKYDAKCDGVNAGCPSQENKPDGDSCGNTINIGGDSTHHQICKSGSCLECGVVPSGSNGKCIECKISGNTPYWNTTAKNGSSCGNTGEGNSFPKVCNNGKCLGCPTPPSGSDGKCLECKLSGDSPFWDMASKDGDSCGNTLSLGEGYGGKGNAYSGICSSGVCKKCDSSKVPAGSNGSCLKCKSNGTWDTVSANGSSCDAVYGFFKGQCSNGKCTSQETPYGVGNPSTAKDFSAYIVRDKNNFSFNGIAYIIAPHVNLEKEATITINYANFSSLGTPETYKSEDEKLILSVCKNSIINKVSKSIGITGGVIDFNNEISVNIPANALKGTASFTITKYDLSGCPNSNGAICKPKTCNQLKKTCGSVSDGCQGTIDCGSCPLGKICIDGTCGISCAPKSCAQLGKKCGSVSDGCQGKLNCGDCENGSNCVNGNCSKIIQICNGADINRDGKVDNKDLSIIWANLNKKDCAASNSWCSGGDVDRDGKVDTTDLTTVFGNYNKNCLK